jgi:YVTN family beta-propeller protein
MSDGQPFGRKRGQTMGRRTRTIAAGTAVFVAALTGAGSSAGATGSVELVVADVSSSALVRIDAPTGTIGPTIPVGQWPNAVAITPNGRTAYTAVGSSDSVVPVDLETSTAGTAIPVACPTTIAIVPGGQKAYITQSCGTTVVPLDLSTNTVGTPIEVGERPWGVAVSPDGETVYATTGTGALGSADALVPIDVHTNVPGPPISLGPAGDPASVVVTPDGSTAFVAMEQDDVIVPVDLVAHTSEAPIPVSTKPVGLALTPDGTELFVTHYERTPSGLGQPTPHDVTPIDVASRTALPQIVVGSQTTDVAVTADGATAYVAVLADADTGAAIVPLDVATQTVGAPIPFPGSPLALAIRPSAEPDTTPPTLSPTVTGTGPGGAVLLHDTSVLASPNADDGSGSGVASSSCGAPDVSTAGLHAVTCSATDVAGNTSTATVTYVVQYRLVGLYPSDGSSARAGKPLKIGVSLADATGAPAALCAGCGVDVQMLAVGAGGEDAGPFAMGYHNGSDEYRYAWKPSSATRGTTRIVASVGYPGTTATTTAEALVTIT